MLDAHWRCSFKKTESFPSTSTQMQPLAPQILQVQCVGFLLAGPSAHWKSVRCHMRCHAPMDGSLSRTLANSLCLKHAPPPPPSRSHACTHHACPFLLPPAFMEELCVGILSGDCLLDELSVSDNKLPMTGNMHCVHSFAHPLTLTLALLLSLSRSLALPSPSTQPSNSSAVCWRPINWSAFLWQRTL
jgi:hypothetical protein